MQRYLMQRYLHECCCQPCMYTMLASPPPPVLGAVLVQALVALRLLAAMRCALASTQKIALAATQGVLPLMRARAAC
jgi:hypothetical protein